MHYRILSRFLSSNLYKQSAMVQTKVTPKIITSLSQPIKKSVDRSDSKSNFMSHLNLIHPISLMDKLDGQQRLTVPGIMIENRKLSTDSQFDIFEQNDNPRDPFGKKENKRLSINELKAPETILSRRSSLRSNLNNFRSENSINRRNSLIHKDNSSKASLRNSFFDLDMNNCSSRIKHHVTSLLSYDAQITMLQMYEELIVSGLSRMNYDSDSLPRIQIALKPHIFGLKTNSLPEMQSGQNEIMESKRLRISYLIEIAMKIIDLIEKSKKRHFSFSKPESIGDIFRLQNDSVSMVSYHTNSIDSLDVYDPLEVFTKWVFLCTNELKN
ncbi:hypothetical protein BpHYR1_015831 [Brachionus plicatilis]|uniref:Uncharacterized protein n=1 Tax=Brachionus plicatilis TaxID=10195 RepID=A0A3M7SNM6_BRAPC|nr:hypothetical protein BpHYR1_015831 [Brachionus plicatilis]